VSFGTKSETSGEEFVQDKNGNPNSPQANTLFFSQKFKQTPQSVYFNGLAKVKGSSSKVCPIRRSWWEVPLAKSDTNDIPNFHRDRSEPWQALWQHPFAWAAVPVGACVIHAGHNSFESVPEGLGHMSE
jgi:hypothetical protein